MGVIPQTLTAGEGDLLPHQTPSPAFGWVRARLRPGVGTQTLVPFNFLAVVAPLRICVFLRVYSRILYLYRPIRHICIYAYANFTSLHK